MNPEEGQKAWNGSEGERTGRERPEGEREYRQPYSRMRRRPYRMNSRGPMYDEYPTPRYAEGREEGPVSHPMRGYRSYPPGMYPEARHIPYRRDTRYFPDMYPRRRPLGGPMPYYNDHRPRPYYKKRYPPVDQTPVNILSIFGLGTNATEEDLTQWLAEKLGNEIEVTKIDLISDKYTGHCKGYGFISFRSVENAKHAKEILSGQSFNNGIVRVEYSITQTGHKKEQEKEFGNEAGTTSQARDE